jgi:hypothetical protein
MPSGVSVVKNFEPSVCTEFGTTGSGDLPDRNALTTMQPPSLGPIRLFTMESVFGDADAPIVVELAQNQIYRAFREVGRVMRTVALLRFLADSGLRARVTAAPTRPRPTTGSPPGPRFGNQGVIAENDPAEQESRSNGTRCCAT